MSQTTTQKQRFFALYLGCEVQTNYRFESEQGKAMIKAKGKLMEVDLGMDNFGILLETEKDKTNYTYLNKGVALILRPISSLTDEELEKIGKMFGLRNSDSVRLYLKKREDIKFMPYCFADYLRSIGVLIPFDGLTTEQIIAQGWAEIKA